MKPGWALAATTMALLISGTVARAERGPSTPEERKKAVELVESLETDPLGPGAQEARRWLTTWTIEIPDISVKVCTELVGPALGKKYHYSAEVGLQPMYSATRFAIEHPDKATDDIAMYLAGTEGALRVYEVLLKTKPDAKLPFFDDLIAKRDRGELLDFVTKAAKKCK